MATSAVDASAASTTLAIVLCGRDFRHHVEVAAQLYIYISMVIFGPPYIRELLYV